MHVERAVIGDKHKVWWGEQTLISVTPYTGIYAGYYNCVLRFTADNRRGWLEISGFSAELQKTLERLQELDRGDKIKVNGFGGKPVTVPLEGIRMQGGVPVIRYRDLGVEFCYLTDVLEIL